MTMTVTEHTMLSDGAGEPFAVVSIMRGTQEAIAALTVAIREEYGSEPDRINTADALNALQRGATPEGGKLRVTVDGIASDITLTPMWVY